MEKSLHTLTLGGQTHSYLIFSKSIFYIRNREVKWFRRDELYFICFICFDLHQTGSFSVTDSFLTTFYVEKRNGILCKNRGEEFEKSYVPLRRGRGGQKLPKLSK